MLVPPRAWAALVAHPASTIDVDAWLRAPTMTPPFVESVECPVCARRMERDRFGNAAGVVIDTCIDHGMWLDAGELSSIAKAAAQRTFSTPQFAVPDPRFDGRFVRPGPSVRKVFPYVRVLLVLLLFAQILWCRYGSKSLQKYGHDSARAAEGANTALSH